MKHNRIMTSRKETVKRGCNGLRALLVLVSLLGACNAADREEGDKRMNGKSDRIQEEPSGEWTPELTPGEKTALFAIAEDTLKWCVKGGTEFSFDEYKITEKLEQKTATFVTLKIKGRLRGCIGSLEPVAPLYQSVHDNTVSAAMKDPRFPPVTQNELEDVDIHVSILSPIRDIESLDEFRIGEHGIIMRKGWNRAVYLPEVAVEQKWSKEETLSSLSMKAGLDPSAWREGASFKVFSSVVLSRSE